MKTPAGFAAAGSQAPGSADARLCASLGMFKKGEPLARPYRLAYVLAAYIARLKIETSSSQCGCQI